MSDLALVSVIIPSLNEAPSLRELLPILGDMNLGQVLVCDNGSTDETKEVVQTHGVTWVYEPVRGYGAACYAGMEALSKEAKVVVFLDADLSDDPNYLPKLVAPILQDECDLVIGARAPQLRQPQSMTWPQVVANQLFPICIKLGWGFRYTDLGPFRAIRRVSLDQINMQDRAFGWTIEMQIRAVEQKLRIREMDVPYRKRPRGPSKISGTIRGVISAAYWITKTCASLWLTKRSRVQQSKSEKFANS